MLTEAEFRHAVLDPHVGRRRVMVYGRGIYINVVELERAFASATCTSRPVSLIAMWRPSAAIASSVVGS